jgi:hypothetical protein
MGESLWWLGASRRTPACPARGRDCGSKRSASLISSFDLSVSARTAPCSYRDGIGQSAVGCRWIQRYPVSDRGRSHSPRRWESVVFAERPRRTCFGLYGADHRVRHPSAHPSWDFGKREN